jgi:signal transduction histidine kinase
LAVADVARGRYQVRVQRPGLGAEFDELTDAFNLMAARLHQVEDTRSRLLADLAHELRTPVATLGAYSEALEDGVTTLDADTLAVMKAQIGRLARLAEDVSAVSRAEEGERILSREIVDASTLISDACAAAAERYAAKGVVLARDVAGGLPTVTVDRDRMAQVFGNVLDNALRYTPAGGTVTVEARQRDDRLQIRVTDSGEGISPEHLPHVFERFYRADIARDRTHGGSGIGLAIVKALVEAHGGRVEASSPGQGFGAMFTLDLPLKNLDLPLRDAGLRPKDTHDTELLASTHPGEHPTGQPRSRARRWHGSVRARR